MKLGYALKFGTFINFNPGNPFLARFNNESNLSTPTVTSHHVYAAKIHISERGYFLE